MAMAFVRADSTNLPMVENVMILEFMAVNDCYNLAEIRSAKALLSSRSSYVDAAVGYVQINRVQQQCTIRAQIVPEHKVRNKNYVVVSVIDEENNSIVSSECDGCAAAAGGCKHSLVLLYWLEKRFSEPSTTEVKCYWAKPKLKDLTSRPVLIKDVNVKKKQMLINAKSPEVLNNFINECKKHNVKDSLFSLNTGQNNTHSYNLYDMSLQFMSEESNHTFENFYNFVNKFVNEDLVKEIQNNTVLQAKSKLWHSIRQGRLTGSKIYEASVCNTDGALVQQILGGYKVPETKAIRRGKSLENIVLKQVSKELNCEIKECGIILINGIIGASPDGIRNNFVVEIKCSMSEKTLKNYIKDNEINNKFKAQIQLQMHAAKLNKGVFCVADPNFEHNKIIHKYWVDYDKQFVDLLINKAVQFYKNFIFPKILSSAKT